MINFNLITDEELSELKNVILKNTEKSELEKFYLFDNNPIVTSKVFLLCRRFLESAYNIVADGDLKNELLKELANTEVISREIFFYIESINRVNFGKRNFERKLNILVKNPIVTDLIDMFSILLERVNVIKISRFKGIVIEGKSGIEAKKIFGDFHEV